ncbi:MAG TPA: PQQ-dependent sugar dehydrogenase [bacterium]|nr:PQQ-dependent sugar dehydrogenase [bacterium]
MSVGRFLAGVTTAILAGGAGAPSGAAVPSGFLAEHVVTGPFTGNVVGVDVLPDGRPVIIEQTSGVVRLAASGSAVADSILTVPGVNTDHPERGLLGVLVDPDWPARPYVYFHYTHTDSVIHVMMYTATGDLSDPASTSVSLGSPFFVFNDLPDSVGIHNAGGMRFGPDGMLYLGLGDDSRSCQPQTLASRYGKMLRLDVSGLPQGGSGPPALADITPPDNPFPGLDPFQNLVYAWGLRNPFRFDLDPLTGDLFIGSVGGAFFEEINFAPGTGYPGFNYGWPQFEGTMPLNCCGTCGQGNTFTFPIHTIEHTGVFSAVIGGSVFRSSAAPLSFPSDYDGDYLYFEHYAGTGHRIRDTGGGVWDFAPPVPGQPDSVTWCDGFRGVADVRLGPDGALWLAALGNPGGVARGVYRIRPDTAAVDVPATAAPAGSGPLGVPNPARAGRPAEIRFAADVAGPVVARVHDAAGRLVRTVRSRAPAAGSAAVAWNGMGEDGSPLPAGVYWVRVETASGRVRTAKVTLVR